jgi:methyltransferase family protein
MNPFLRRWKYRIGTLLGRPRREHILRLVDRYSKGAEVGVFKGDLTIHILQMVRPTELHLIDAWWTLYGDRYPDWGAYSDFGRLTTRAAFERVEAIVQRHGKATRCEFHVEDDLVCLRRFADHCLDWAYLDTSHEFEQTRAELELLRCKVRVGGTILGDDWQDDPSHPHHGVAKAVEAFCARHGWIRTHRDAFAQWALRERPKTH